MWQHLALISGGAAIGACLRWGLGSWLNPFVQHFAFGTLIANYLGCFIAGILLALIWQFPAFNPAWRLFLITGLLGSLTTFSAFSTEVMEKLFQAKWGLAFSLISLHLIGGLLCTALGIYLVRWLRNIHSC